MVAVPGAIGFGTLPWALKTRITRNHLSLSGATLFAPRNTESEQLVKVDIAYEVVDPRWRSKTGNQRRP